MRQVQKLFIVAAFLLLSASVFGQQSNFSLLGKVGYQSDFDRLGLGAEGRIGLTEQFRLAPSLMLMIPNDNVLGLEVDVNLQYVFPIQGTTLDIYPTMGFNMDNNRFKKDSFKRKWTKWGYNLGAGADYYLSKDDFLNFELQYTFGPDFARVMIGYGYKF